MGVTILSKSGNEGVPAVEKAWASEPRRSSFCLHPTRADQAIPLGSRADEDGQDTGDGRALG